MVRGPFPGVVAGLIAFLAAPSARALDPTLAATQYAQTVWRADRDDLPHDSVSAIAQTRDGYVWIGTVEGLARFDGVRTTVFEKANTPEIRNNWIRALLVDREDRLWIATFGGGLVCLDHGRFVGYQGQGAPDVITSLFEDDAGVLVGTEVGGVFRVRGSRLVREPGLEAVDKLSVRAFATDPAGTLWIGTEAGLFRRERGSAALVRQADLGAAVVASVAVAPDGVYAGTETGLARVRDGRATLLTARDGLSHPRVWSLLTDSDGVLWVGTDGGGLDRLAGGRLTSFSTRNGLTNDFVWALFEDREKSLWVGTNGGGVNQLRNGRVVTLSTREGLPSDFTWSVLRLRDGTLLAGTEDAGVASVREGTVSTFAPYAVLRDRVRSLAEDARGRVWIGTDHGLFRREQGRLARVRIDGIDDARFLALLEDAAGGMWVGVMGAAHRIVDDRIVESGEGFNPTAMHFARDGSLWVAATSGLWRRHDGRFVGYSKDAGLPSDYVTSVLEAPDGTLWAATRGGLARFRDGRFAAVTAKEGLPEDAIVSAVLADDGSVWLGTNRGLFEVPLADVARALDGGGPIHSRAIGLDDGMRTLEVNGSGSSRAKDADGTIWFATRAGLVSVPPRSSEPPLVPPPVRIEEAVADGTRLAGPPPWRFAAGTRRVDVHFTALGFRAPHAIRLRHRLDGFDSDWVDAGEDRTAHYTGLPHGRYVLRVIAAGPDGVWSQEPAVAALEIAPRLHETLWFRVVAATLVLVAVPLFHLARLRLLRRQKAELERLVAERTAEVAAANERLAQLVREDALTGVASRRRFDEAIEEEWRRAQRTGQALALVLADVDSFKAFNDRLGHPAGDACLRAVAAAVATAAHRAGELVARYGGEEFALLLPGATVEGAHAVAETVRQRVADLAIAHPDSEVAPVVTVSVGVAVRAPDAATGPGDLVATADRALYAAKQNGRNRVESVG